MEVFASMGFKPLLFVLRCGMCSLPVVRFKEPRVTGFRPRHQVASRGRLLPDVLRGNHSPLGGGGFLKVVGSPGQ